MGRFLALAALALAASYIPDAGRLLAAPVTNQLEQIEIKIGD